MLRAFGRTLDQYNIDHRIISVTNDGRTVFGLSSMERIAYLARIRNKTLEPIQSSDPSVRVPEWETFTEIIFMNDVVFTWQDMVRLIGSRFGGDGDSEEDYDMVCALHFAGSGAHLPFRKRIDAYETGSYDTWVGRDICGSELITSWPYAKDHQSVEAVRNSQPFEVATDWHGAVVLNADPSCTRRTLHRCLTWTASPTSEQLHLIIHETSVHGK